jgi:hypothetical protein
MKAPHWRELAPASRTSARPRVDSIGADGVAASVIGATAGAATAAAGAGAASSRSGAVSATKVPLPTPAET